MGTLTDFDTFLVNRRKTVTQIEERLTALQAKYETFFTEVSAVREKELAQLIGHVTKGPDGIPPVLAKQLATAQAQATKDFEEMLSVLELEKESLAKAAEEIRAKSMAEEEAVHKRNLDLDAKEEALKARDEALLKQIDDYNGRIRELGTGFGFFKNFFAMRRLQAERDALDAEQASLAHLIEKVRTAWAERDATWAANEAARREKWIESRTRLSAAETKIDALREARTRMILRTTAEKVLFERKPKVVAPAKGDPPCPRCKSPNSKASSFCRICAARLLPDRPDLEGSLEEIAEANVHYLRFAEGMKSCQQVIALVRGLGLGLEAFRKSVLSMIESQSKYPLPKLQIDVPPECVEYGKNLTLLRDAVAPEQSLHPKEFGEQMEALTKVFGEDAIKAWFERMGEEMSACAKKQWG